METARALHRKMEATLRDLHEVVREARVLSNRSQELCSARRRRPDARQTITWDARSFASLLTQGGLDGYLCEELDKLSEEQLLSLLAALGAL
jgi:hypothetical protein